MNTIAAQDIKRRGISAVDEYLKNGPVHVIKNNRPQYVVLTEERYRELVEAEGEAHLIRIRESLADVKAGRTRKFRNVDELMKALEEDS